MKKLLLFILLMPILSQAACKTFKDLGDSLCLTTLRSEDTHLLNGFQATWINDRCFIRRNNITLISKSSDDKDMQYFWVQGANSPFLQSLVIERLSEVCLKLEALTAQERQKAEQRAAQEQVDTFKKALL